MNKPVFALEDIELLKELILYTIQTQDDIAIPLKRRKKLEAIYHRMSRITSEA
tara:strand:- start:133 stop:291 length:159 start_codon:yes stop_codon:yes gene_type:complete